MWECDRQNETSQQKMLRRQSILLTKVCYYSPFSLHVAGEAAAESGGRRTRGVWTHTHGGPLTLVFAVFFMIRDQITSL